MYYVNFREINNLYDPLKNNKSFKLLHIQILEFQDDLKLKYVIYADEAWTQSNPLYRYHCIFGGLISTENHFKALDKQIKSLKKQHNYSSKEIKWSKISLQNINFYNDLLQVVEKFINTTTETKYRQMFMDRAYRYTGTTCSEIETQFKVYYQFLKHCFGFEHAPKNTYITLKLDTHSSHHHRNQLTEYLKSLVFSNVKIKVEFIDSKKSCALQICDLLMGAAGYHGNKISWDLMPGKNRRTKNQLMKAAFSKNVYELLKRIDATHRGSKAFNWFETTGTGGIAVARYNHKLRIWKFIPTLHIYDPSWEDSAFSKNAVRKK